MDSKIKQLDKVKEIRRFEEVVVKSIDVKWSLLCMSYTYIYYSF